MFYYFGSCLFCPLFFFLNQHCPVVRNTKMGMNTWLDVVLL